MTGYELHVRRWNRCQQCKLCARRSRVVLCRGKIPCDVLFVGEAPGESENVLGQPFVGPAGQLLDRIVAQGIPAELRVAYSNLVACIPKPAPPTVVRIKDGCDIVIDRTSPWGNPFHLGKDGSREQVIGKYAEWLAHQDHLLQQLPSLAGKRLGCHCAPLACHGDEIVAAFLRRVSSKIAEPPEWAIKACALRLQELYALCRPKLVVCVGKLAAKHAMPCPLPACLRGARWIEVVHPAAILRADVSQRGLAVQRTVAILADAASDLLDGL